MLARVEGPAFPDWDGRLRVPGLVALVGAGRRAEAGHMTNDETYEGLSCVDHRPRVVVGVDGSTGSRAALQWAVEEARLRGAVVEPVLVWHPPEYAYAYASTMALVPAPSITEEAALRAKLWLDKALEGVPEGTEMRPQLLEGHAAKVLVQVAEGADLLVVGSRGRGGFAGLLLGSVSRACAHHGTCPVVIVPPPRTSGGLPPEVAK